MWILDEINVAISTKYIHKPPDYHISASKGNVTIIIRPKITNTSYYYGHPNIVWCFLAGQ